MTDTLNDFLTAVKTAQPVQFANTLAIITQHYHYQATTFSNGIGDNPLVNSAGTNEGSCKIFAFAQLHQLNEQETLPLFGEFYHTVLANPQGEDHQNIRCFMREGWAGICFMGKALQLK